MLWLKELQEKMLQDLVSQSTQVPYLVNPERFELYGRGYFFRIFECMTSEYPMIKWMMGEESFQKLCVSYIHEYPTHNYNLNYLGMHLPEFVQRHSNPHFPWLSDLATYENNQTLSHDQARKKPVDIKQFQSTPLDEWENAKFSFQPHMVLQRTEWSFEKLKDAYDHKTVFTADLVNKEPNHFVFYQDDQDTNYITLISAKEFLALELLQKGHSLGEVIEIMHADNIMESIFGWFQQWHALELIINISFETHES